VSYISCNSGQVDNHFLITDKIREVQSKIEKLVAEKNWDEAKAVAVRLKYLQGIADAIKQRLDHL
jgi:molecular chaperone HscB